MSNSKIAAAIGLAVCAGAGCYLTTIGEQAPWFWFGCLLAFLTLVD